MQQPYIAEIDIPVDRHVIVSGNLSIPTDAKGLVIFTHSTANSRLSQPNRVVADYLLQQGFATFLFDHLAPGEGDIHDRNSNIRLLAERLIIVSEWLLFSEQTSNYHQAYFSTSTGAAAALYAAAAEGAEITAVVSRSGRPDLVMEVLPTLQTPTLLIVGSNDHEIVTINQKAFEVMHCPKRLEVIPGASHLFEEAGAMEKVCVQAAAWFEQYLHTIRMIR